VSPDGSTVVENFAKLRGTIGQQTGAFDTETAQPLPNTGLEGKPLCMPAFSPDGLLLAYVDCSTMDLRAYDWDPAGKKATNDRLLSLSSQNPASAQIQYPTASPDHAWIVYGRGSSLGSLGNHGDLYTVSVANPGAEIALGALNGSTYPFAADRPEPPALSLAGTGHGAIAGARPDQHTRILGSQPVQGRWAGVRLRHRLLRRLLRERRRRHRMPVHLRWVLARRRSVHRRR
jgi:hypothetical protein